MFQDEKQQIIMLLGSTGLAGQAFDNYLRNLNNVTVVTVARKNADINLDLSKQKKLHELLNDISPDLIINAAANTNLEMCDKFPGDTFAINTMMPKKLSQFSKKHQKQLLHLSTDHYHSGNGPFAFSEEVPVELLNNYAKQKYLAENLVKRSEFALSIRTNIIGIRGWEKKTFGEWALNIVDNSLQSKIYSEVWTSSIDIISFVKFATELFLNQKCTGLLNLASSSVFSKADFVIELARQKNKRIDNFEILPFETGEFIRANSMGLDCSKAMALLKVCLPTLEDVVSSLIKQQDNWENGRRLQKNLKNWQP